VTRGLFFSFFIRITIALALVAAMRIWFNPRGWVLEAVLVIAWAAINAFFLARSVRQNITRLQASTAAIPEAPRRHHQSVLQRLRRPRPRHLPRLRSC